SCLVLSTSECASSALVLSIFFFSSRRRHTRFSRDWSSDVCSSDLTPAPQIVPTGELKGFVPLDNHQAVPAPLAVGKRLSIAPERSEERRVGKECRCRWSRSHYKKKRGNAMHAHLRT